MILVYIAYFLDLRPAGIMIMRIYAMYGQSRLMLGVLLVLFVAVMTLQLVIGIKYYGPHSGLTSAYDFACQSPADSGGVVTQFHLLNTYFCLDALGPSPMFFIYACIPSAIFDALLVALATIRLVKHSIEMNEAIGRWRLNHCMKIIVRDSVLYFIL